MTRRGTSERGDLVPGARLQAQIGPRGLHFIDFTALG